MCAMNRVSERKREEREEGRERKNLLLKKHVEIITIIKKIENPIDLLVSAGALCPLVIIIPIIVYEYFFFFVWFWASPEKKMESERERERERRKEPWRKGTLYIQMCIQKSITLNQ